MSKTREDSSATPAQVLGASHGITGEHDLSERELSELRGWRGSRMRSTIEAIATEVTEDGERDEALFGQLVGYAWRLDQSRHGSDMSAAAQVDIR
jgi:hypothetical protein